MAPTRLSRGLVAIVALCAVSCAQGSAADELGTCTEESPTTEESALFQSPLLHSAKRGRVKGDAAHSSALEAENWASESGSRNECDLCAKEWVIVLATGRSGSTSALQMLNAVPGFFIAGEHMGAIEDLMDFWRVVFEKPWGMHGVKSDTHSIGAWFHAARSESQVLCALQSAAQTLLGDVDSSAYTTLGFKEIRYTSPDMLAFLARLFPCARFVVNVRRNLEEQTDSSWWSSTARAENILKNMTRNLRVWQASDPSSRFLLELEEFSSVDVFNNMLSWLGVTGCSYTQVAHAHANGGYNTSSGWEGAFISGTCSRSRRDLGQRTSPRSRPGTTA